VTIYDIAKKAGVSASTVSRVINNKPGISESTRKRIQKLLKESDYTPDVMARGLVTQASRLIGILIEDIRVAHHTDSVYVIEQEMTAQGYTCITMSTGKEPEKKADAIRVLEQRRVQGVILIGSMFASEEVQKAISLHLSHVPVVIVNGQLDLPNVYNILVDEAGGMKECVEFLAKKGRKKIACILDVSTPSNANKREGFRKGMEASHLPLSKAQIVTAPGSDTDPWDSLDRGRKAAEILLKQDYDVDAVLCETDLLAIGCMQVLKERNIQIPAETAVMGVDNTFYGEICSPSLSSLDNKQTELSRNAAHILLDVFAGRSASHKIMLFPAIVERKSA
jgi:LacI family transcriptional regulator